MQFCKATVSIHQDEWQFAGSVSKLDYILFPMEPNWFAVELRE